MRELYAVELRPSSPEVGADASARRLISEWATRPFDDIEATSLEGTRMYRNAVIPIAFANEAAAYPIGVGSEVLRLVAKEKLGLSTQAPPAGVARKP